MGDAEADGASNEARRATKADNNDGTVGIGIPPGIWLSDTPCTKRQADTFSLINGHTCPQLRTGHEAGRKDDYRPRW